jgi:hypothetical protein
MPTFIDIIQILQREKIPAVGLDWRDEQYAFVGLSWWSGPFALEQKERRRAAVDDAWDCEDFSDEAAVLARRMHADAPNRTAKAGLAVGNCHYTRDAGGLHCINWFIYGARGVEKVGFYEPQESAVVKLSKHEIESIERLTL